MNTRWRIAVLVSAAIAISYLDRQTLPVAIGAIREDIPISNQVKAFLDSAFLLTYGDGVIDSDINASVAFHQKQKKVVTITAVQPAARDVFA